MSKIGKDMYIEFDPLDQRLILRTINDAKSAFSAFTFRAAFFERCRTPSNMGRQVQQSQEDDEDDYLYKCRVPLRALLAVTKTRKGVVSLRVRNEITADHMYLSFEFRVENRAGNISHVQHKIGVVEADSVQAVTNQDCASDLLAIPRKLLQMIEPLKKTPEVALVVNYEAMIVTLSSFHHSSAEENNVVLQSQSASLLKTETSVGADEFEEFQYIDTRDTDRGDNIPSNVNSEVTMVFTLREPKAMLQFCQSADEDLRININFHWGGKPIVFKTDTPIFSGKLVMATLDFRLLRGTEVS
eukprot:CAMPEP_0194153012 /NCGR_PEP_ID=MMETSP0152-20130528/54951_1 /TAXON_ID=1049557 /ORGANISM="Thalassiothrix antarctica, Strain L6-D1" /LENGTH=299 /DNA_ID=CAMNT_0038858031 /DNA_START=108 /DNA_END=1004 /DNA_ORIENTATION=-